MFKYIVSCYAIFSLAFQFSYSQTNTIKPNSTCINCTETPNEDAAFEIQSTSKGILIPKLSTSERESITTPSNGLLVFDENSNSFWFAKDSIWRELDDNLFEGNVRIDDGLLSVVNPGSATGNIELSSPEGNPGIIMRSNDPENYRADIRRKPEGLFFAVDETTGVPSVKMSILNNGKVGIGTLDPHAQLDVNGSLIIQGQNLQHQGSDFNLGTNDGRDIGSKTAQRALVHHHNDRLYINYDGDFEGGVSVAGSKLNVVGNLGVGTNQPEAKLHVNGNIKVTDDFDISGLDRIVGYNDLRLFGTPSDGIADLFIANNGNIGIGTTNPSRKLDVNGNIGGKGLYVTTGILKLSSRAWGMTFEVNTDDIGSDYFLFKASNKEVMKINTDGKVVIGDIPNMTTPDGYKLYVDDGILAERVRIALSSSDRWADNAFGKQPSLEQMENFIKENSHLIGMPSAAALEKSGIEVVDMFSNFLQQIEWTWEHLIAERKEKDEKIKALENKAEKLEERLSSLEKILANIQASSKNK